MARTLASLSLLLSLTLCLDAIADEPPPLEWEKSDSTVALVRGGDRLWQFNYGTDLTVPFFHPLSTGGGHVLTWDRPPDHAWHHGLWFCWKYINGVNYWEHDRQTGKPSGRTRTTNVQVETLDDHSARISMTLVYHPEGEADVVLREQRRIDITSPDARGEYHLDWASEFTAGSRVVELDRTPPKEQSWGGYAGLSVRFSKELIDRQVTSDTGPVEFGSGDRHRSRATCMDYSGVIAGDPVGLAFIDHPDNPRHPTPWYVIRSPVMGYMNAALLNDEPLTLEPGGRMTLRYRLIVHPQRWSAARLQAARAEYWRFRPPSNE